MSQTRFIEQPDPPRPPKETLPTMYDLPDEDPEEPGLPDEFHYLQPNLLSVTFRLVMGVPRYTTPVAIMRILRENGTGDRPPED